MKRILYLIIITSFLTACEKVINAGLRPAEKKYVIEGFVTNEDTCRVLLSVTSNFADSNKFRGVGGAVVQVSDNGGAPVTLPEIKKGVYQSLKLKGIPGHTYQLKVTIEGLTFTASSTMPSPVDFSVLYIDRIAVAGRNRIVANVGYRDPETPGNNYNFVRYVNGVQRPDVYVNNDNLSNGRDVFLALYSPTELREEDDILEGDSLRVEMQCIDANVYKFWYSLNSSASGSDVLVTPSNPVSNVTGGALGYFSAHTVQYQGLRVQ